MKMAMIIIIGWGRDFSSPSLGPQCGLLQCMHRRQCSQRRVRIQEKKINPAQMPFAMLWGAVASASASASAVASAGVGVGVDVDVGEEWR